MAETQLPVEHLFTITADVEMSRESIITGGPQGGRMIANVPGGSFEGPKLRGTVAVAAQRNDHLLPVALFDQGRVGIDLGVFDRNAWKGFAG